MRYGHIIRAIAEQPWAIHPAKLAAIIDLLALKAAGGEVSPAEVAAATGGGRPVTAGGGGVAVIPVIGTISQRAELLTESSGGTSVERLRANLRAALADPAVGAVVLDIDSPGGSVAGVEEMAAEVYRSRGSKPIVAAANAWAASAAYWIASAADEVWVTPSGEVGSVGVIAAHEDVSRALDAQGVTVSLITAGEFKGEGNPYAPLTDEARAYLQGRVDDYHAMFIRAVARGRTVSPETVRADFGGGRMVGAKEAVRLGMADAVGTIDEAIGRAATLMRAKRRATATATAARARAGLAS